MSKRITVGILFGGKSAEHEVSLQSARNVFDAIDKDKYEPVLIGISKAGQWLSHRDPTRFILDADDPARVRLDETGDAVSLTPQSNGRIAGMAEQIDVVFPLLHGPFGEDGTVQGLLKLADLPFVGAGVLASAVGMDKDVMKRLLRDAGIPIGGFCALRAHERVPAYDEVVARLGAPLFIKPANMGSSIGVSKARDAAEYRRAIEEAFRYDTKLIMEECIEGRELECSVLGNEEPIASLLGEVRSSHEFYSYKAKYLDENGAALDIPATLPESMVKAMQRVAISTFQALGAEGLSRIDFFLKDDGAILVNEINTMPGFTRISMYPKLWDASGISYTELIDRLIELAFRRFAKERALRTSR
jgi:D-alanine-D-alanine ligase